MVSNISLNNILTFSALLCMSVHIKNTETHELESSMPMSIEQAEQQIPIMHNSITEVSYKFYCN